MNSNALTLAGLYGVFPMVLDMPEVKPNKKLSEPMISPVSPTIDMRLDYEHSTYNPKNQKKSLGIFIDLLA